MRTDEGWAKICVCRNMLLVHLGVVWLGMTNVLWCESFQLQPAGMRTIASTLKLIGSPPVGIGRETKSWRCVFPLFGIKADALFDMKAIIALEKELEWNGTETRLEEMASSSASIDDGVEELDDVEGEDSSLETQYTVPAALHDQRIDAVLSTLEPGLSRSRCGSLISSGSVDISKPQSAAKAKKGVKRQRVTVTRKSERLAENTTLHVRRDDAASGAPNHIIPEDLPLNILFEDEHMIVLNKAAGMVVHPGAGNRNGTVVNALAYYLAYSSPFGSGEFIGADGEVLPASPAASPLKSPNDANDDTVRIDGTDGEETSTLLRPGIVHRLDKVLFCLIQYYTILLLYQFILHSESTKPFLTTSLSPM